jgi:hypothetical protein
LWVLGRRNHREVNLGSFLGTTFLFVRSVVTPSLLQGRDVFHHNVPRLRIRTQVMEMRAKEFSEAFDVPGEGSTRTVDMGVDEDAGSEKLDGRESSHFGTDGAISMGEYRFILDRGDEIVVFRKDTLDLFAELLRQDAARFLAEELFQRWERYGEFQILVFANLFVYEV